MANTYAPHLRTPETSRNIMKDVCLALLPAGLGSILFFGINALILILVASATCVAAEALWQAACKQPVTVSDCSALVTGILLAFNLSSNTPVWAVILAGVFSIIVVKQLFGGLGSNVVNPALMGRLFLMTVYPAKIMSYAEPLNPDAVSTATVLSALKAGKDVAYTMWDAMLGKVPGALGETSAVLLLAGFLYLALRKEVNVCVSAAFFATVFVFSLAVGQNPFWQLFSGGMILGGCFMLTDYNFANRRGNLIYGIAAGILVCSIRFFSPYPEGVCYGILMTNAMGSLLAGICKKHVYGISEGGK